MTHVYSIVSPLDGSTETCSLSELSQQLKLNSILCELNGNGTLIDSWPLVHGTLVTFAVEFADYTLLNYTKKKIPEAEACIALTRKWLENSETVSKEELRVAANAARAAARAAAYAAANADYAAANAAYAASYAAANAADAAYANANAADAAANAAYAYAAGGDENSREAELIRQGQFIVEHLKSSSSK